MKANWKMGEVKTSKMNILFLINLSRIADHLHYRMEIMKETNFTRSQVEKDIRYELFSQGENYFDFAVTGLSEHTRKEAEELARELFPDFV